MISENKWISGKKNAFISITKAGFFDKEDYSLNTLRRILRQIGSGRVTKKSV
tara:strand:- start:183 stop:338 length:156 start_codon:yes stop_codon:yes gene_type:complete